MSHAIPGIHHVTAISGPPQPNVDFYVGRLGQRLVKKTVNFDAPDTYHLYYGDRTGTPGTILTFFPFVGAPPGHAGPGMAAAVAYAMSAGGLGAWTERLAEHAIRYAGPTTRFGEQMITVADPDGLAIELVASRASDGAEKTPLDHGFHSVTLCVSDPAPTAGVLTDLFGYESVGQETINGVERFRFRSPSQGCGSIVDLIRPTTASPGRQGAGTVHHVAFRAETAERQLEWRERALDFGLRPTPVIDRQYFDAIYFREPGGILFEIATDPPGFATDETVDELGTHLRLPPQHEPRRADIERVLPSIQLPT